MFIGFFICDKSKPLSVMFNPVDVIQTLAEIITLSPNSIEPSPLI